MDSYKSLFVTTKRSVICFCFHIKDNEATFKKAGLLAEVLAKELKNKQTSRRYPLLHKTTATVSQQCCECVANMS